MKSGLANSSEYAFEYQIFGVQCAYRLIRMNAFPVFSFVGRATTVLTLDASITLEIRSSCRVHSRWPCISILCSRDYILSVTDAAAKQRQAARGIRPTSTFIGRPLLTDHSWERMFHDHLVWKRWTQERMGPYYSPV